MLNTEFFDEISVNHPNWLVSRLDGYSADLEMLNKNWENLCAQLKVSPKQIILVTYLPESDEEVKENPEFTKIMEICDTLTKNGYVVRKNTQLQACSICEKAILTFEVFTYLKDKYRWANSTWSPSCSTCV